MEEESGPRPEPFISQRVIGTLGALAFVVGIVLAVFSGYFWPHSGRLAAAVVVLGVVVGLLNITGREIVPFLVAAVALIIIGQGDVFGPLNNLFPDFGTTIDNIVKRIALFAAPAALVNAIRIALAVGRPGRRLEG